MSPSSKKEIIYGHPCKKCGLNQIEFAVNCSSMHAVFCGVCVKEFIKDLSIDKICPCCHERFDNIFGKNSEKISLYWPIILENTFPQTLYDQ